MPTSNAAPPHGTGHPDAPPPVVFVHGDGDSAAVWMTTLWHFESCGWPPARLHALHMPYPLARDNDDRPQPGRSSTHEHRACLAAEIDRVLGATGAAQVALFASSRGGNAVRSHAAAGGASRMSHAILAGTPNHGARFNPERGLGNEFNGAGRFLMALNNQGAPGVEVTPGPRWLTLRSDNNDKYAQPEATWLGAPGKPTGVSFDGPALRGATNLVLPGADHREVAFSPQAFDAAFRFITGHAPATLAFVPQDAVVLDGQVSGQGIDNDPTTGSFANNLPLAGATVAVFVTHPATGERLGAAVWRKTVGEDGRWGPFKTRSDAHHEFEVTAAGYATNHVYREPFPRSSSLVHLRTERLLETDRSAGAVLTLTRPRGFFGLPRDEVVFDGHNPAPGIPPGVAGLSVSKISLPPGPLRSVTARFNGRPLVGRNWPAADNHLVRLELH
jgi:triacylglycerol lipase